MNIMVYDVAAESGGAVSILKYFYDIHKQDKKNRYYYMLSTFQLKSTENITVVNVPEIKKGWINRLCFDYSDVKKYLKKYHIDEVLSLQNTIIPCFNGKQTVYEHNALPFTEYRYRLSEDKMMWVYQNIIGKFMLESIRKADKVIVQTEWMKNAIEKKVKNSSYKIDIMFPQVEILPGYKYERQRHCTFFYPASFTDFKNHRLVVKAAMILKEQGIDNYSIVFTLKGDESPACQVLYDEAQKASLDIQWVGIQPRDKVFEWYSKSILLFPSYIETVGLPIYEALNVGCPALLADCSYARNVAAGFPNVEYFNYDNASMLADKMKKKILDCKDYEVNEGKV